MVQELCWHLRVPPGCFGWEHLSLSLLSPLGSPPKSQVGVREGAAAAVRVSAAFISENSICSA